MKKIILFAIALLFHFAANAQFGGPIKVINNTKCTINVGLLVTIPGGSCSSQQYATNPTAIPALSTMTFTMTTPPVVVGSPLPVPPASTWEVARVFDDCGAVTVGDPACFSTTGTLHSCCGIYTVFWDPSTHTLTIF
ncbi:MAG: hypothetical protein ACTHJ0_10900 [Flavipsychrobacter sp.]